jgi:hypothetical protein
MANVSLFPFLVFWALLALVVLAIVAYRAAIARKEDDSLHVLHASAAVPQQAAVAEKLERIDKWGKILTVIAAVYGLLLAAAFVYQNWVQSSTSIL